MYPATATDTLAEARAARAGGDVDACLRLSTAARSMAEAEGNASVEFWSCVAPGVMHLGRGEPEEARGYFLWAQETAFDRGLTNLLPASYHDLFLSARDSGDAVAAKRARAVAFELYRDSNARNPRLAGLMADWAEEGFMYNPSEETAAFALQSWRACPCSLPGPKERLLAASNQIVAAAWLGLRPRYRDGVLALETALADLADHECVALALSHASTGAVKLRDYAHALRWAESAVRIAVERGEPAVEDRARYVLSAALAEAPLVRFE